MTGYTVDLAELEEVVTDLDAFAGRLADRLAGLETALAAVHVRWQGQAAQAHGDAHRQTRAGAGEVQAAVAALHGAARTALGAYREAVSANQATWQLTPGGRRRT